MAVKYRNTRTGREVVREDPDPDLDAHPRWERLGRPAAAAPAPANGELPAGNASTETWRAYAVTQGMSPEDAGRASREQLRERFGG